MNTRMNSLLCAALLRAVASGGSRRSERPMGKEPDALPNETKRGEGLLHGLKTLGKVAYLRQLAALVLVTTIGATLIDYVFKTHATADRRVLLRREFLLFGICIIHLDSSCI